MVYDKGASSSTTTPLRGATAADDEDASPTAGATAADDANPDVIPVNDGELKWRKKEMEEERVDERQVNQEGGQGKER